MFPGMNGKQMKQMMKQMGIKQEEIPAEEVIIRAGSKEIVIANPSVSKINMQGQETFQVSGNAELRDADSSSDISDEDIKTVVDQTGVSEEDAKEALEETEGDLAEAIMNLQE